MPEYARVNLGKRTRTPHYVWARPLASNTYFTINREPEMELRHNQLVRVLAHAGKKVRRATQYHLLDTDLLFHLPEQEDLASANAVVLTDPFQKPNGKTDFIAVARTEADVEAAIDRLHALYGQAGADSGFYDCFDRFGKRAATKEDFRNVVGERQYGTVFRPAANIVFNGGIDQVVLEESVEQTVFRV